MLEVAEGVQHLHSEGIVHGDLHGVSILLLLRSRQFIPMSISEIFSSILNSTARSLTLDQPNIMRSP